MGRGGGGRGGFSRHGALTRRDTLESKAVRRPRLNSTLKSLLFWMVLVVVGVLIWNFSNAFAGKSEAPLPFSQFIEQVDSGQVDSVVMVCHDITGQLKNHHKFRTYAPDYDGLAKLLHDKNVAIQAKPETTSPWTALL